MGFRLLCAAAAFGCAAGPRLEVGAPSPGLRAALADTAAEGRVYFADEVARPALLKAGGRTASTGGREGTARVRFVVDTAGRVEPGTLEALAGSDPELAWRFALALEGWRFYPAELPRGRPVRALVEGVLERRGNVVSVRADQVRRPSP